MTDHTPFPESAKPHQPPDAPKPWLSSATREIACFAVVFIIVWSLCTLWFFVLTDEPSDYYLFGKIACFASGGGAVLSCFGPLIGLEHLAKSSIVNLIFSDKASGPLFPKSDIHDALRIPSLLAACAAALALILFCIATILDMSSRLS